MGIRVDLDPSRRPWPCPPGGRGYTFWKDETIRTVPVGGSITYSFTCDTPPSYIGKDSCVILLEKIHTDTTTGADDVPIRLKMNNVEIHVEYHSKIGSPYPPGEDDHDFWLGIQPASHPNYNDTGYNELKVENLGNVAVKIWSCFIYRVYQSSPDCPLVENEPHSPEKTVNVKLNSLDDPINLDPSRRSWPCERGKGGRGYTFWKDDTDRTILPGDYLEYKFTCDVPANYVEKDACLVLLEKVQISADAATNDVPLRIKVNGVEMHVEYHSKKKNHDIWIGVDLGPDPNYNDRGQNIFRIENLDGSRSITLLSCYIYRVYGCTAKPA